MTQNQKGWILNVKTKLCTWHMFIFITNAIKCVFLNLAENFRLLYKQQLSEDNYNESGTCLYRFLTDNLLAVLSLETYQYHINKNYIARFRLSARVDILVSIEWIAYDIVVMSTFHSLIWHRGHHDGCLPFLST